MCIVYDTHIFFEITFFSTSKKCTYKMFFLLINTVKSFTKKIVMQFFANYFFWNFCKKNKKKQFAKNNMCDAATYF